MKVDFEHHLGNTIGEEILNQQDLDRRLSIISSLKPSFSKDGNQWCYLYGELPNDYIVGFGDTPHAAMDDFVNSFYNQKAIVPPK
tara:strand:- start:322 stop:576 length:255 start_codon:yes stop_codon:yes gene_type:complete